MKFIHAANVRLGLPKGEDQAKYAERRAEYQADFEKLIDACNREKADALFLTGNLFAKTVTAEDAEALDSLFARLETARVFMLAGTEDTEETKDLLKSYGFQSKVIYFAGDSIRKIYLPKLNAEITGIGYRPEVYPKLTEDQLLPGKRAPIQILLLPFAGTDAALEDNGFLPQGYDYIGIGSAALQMDTGGKKIYSPGLFEPDGFSDQIRHGYFSGELVHAGGKTDLKCEFRPAASREYLVFRINAEEDVSYEEVEEKVKEAIRSCGEKNYYKIVIRGEASESLYLNKDCLKKAGNVLVIEDQSDNSKAAARIRDSHADDGLGDFIDQIAADEDEEVRQKALRYGMDALLGAKEAGENKE